MVAGGRNIIRMDEGADPDNVQLGDSTTQTYTEGQLIVGDTSPTYTINDNTPLVGSNTNNVVHIDGSIQLKNNNDAIVFGRGTSTFIKDEEIGFGWGGGWYMTDATYLRVRNNKILYSTGEFWASRFNDVNDTSYYGDFASTSRLNNLDVNHFGINNSSSGTRDGISLYGGHSTGEPTYGILFTGTSLGTHGGVTGDWATYFTMSNTTNRGWIFRRVGSGNAASISAAGLGQFNDSVRAPIFYDTNNTGRYVNPNGTSSIQATNFNNANIYNINHIQINDPGAGEGLQWLNGSGWQIYESPDNNSNAAGNLQFATGTTHRFRVDTSGNTFSIASSRSPIFYDTDNTGYYLNPASTSNLNGIDVNGTLDMNSGNYIRLYTGGGNARGYIQATDTNDAHLIIATSGGEDISFRDGGLGGDWNVIMRGDGNTLFRSSTQSPIYYDRDDTNYYANPAGTSVFNGLTVGGL